MTCGTRKRLSRQHIHIFYCYIWPNKGAHRSRESVCMFKIYRNVAEYVWVIDQVWGQDGWILAKFFLACLWTETKARSIKSQKNVANIQQSWPNKLGQWRIYYVAFRENITCGIQRVDPSGQDTSILPARLAINSARFGLSCPLTELANIIMKSLKILKLISSNFHFKAQNKCNPFSVVVYCHSALTVNTRYNNAKRTKSLKFTIVSPRNDNAQQQQRLIYVYFEV